LSGEKNQGDRIALSSTVLTKRGCHVIQSPGDADVDIVKATVKRSRHCSTTLVGEDTDLLILLLHYSRTDSEIIYFRSDANKHSKEHTQLVFPRSAFTVFQSIKTRKSMKIQVNK